MTTEQVETHRFWVDKHGNIWERQSYCLQPTATFARLRGPSKPANPMANTHQYHGEQTEMSGAIGCMNFKDLEPLEHPFLKESKR